MSNVIAVNAEANHPSVRLTHWLEIFAEVVASSFIGAEIDAES